MNEVKDEVLNELSSIFNKKEKIIKTMLDISINMNYNVEESKNNIIEFFKK